MNHIRGAFLYFHLQYVLFQNASTMVRFKRFENGNLYFFALLATLPSRNTNRLVIFGGLLFFVAHLKRANKK